jgi:transcriptional regulator with XRE-family HTH domain
MNLNKQIAKRIKELRISKHKTQEELSFELKLAHSAISHIEMNSGKGRNLTISNIHRICKALDVSLADFFKNFQ